MNLLLEQHSARQARLMRLGFGPRSAPKKMNKTVPVRGARPMIDVGQPLPPIKRDFLFLATPAPEFRTSIIKGIKTTVADKYGITLDDLVSERRTKDIYWPRQVAMYLAARLTLWSRSRVASNPDFDAELKDLERAIRAGSTING
jgi:hypothetical protein